MSHLTNTLRNGYLMEVRLKKTEELERGDVETWRSAFNRLEILHFRIVS